MFIERIHKAFPSILHKDLRLVLKSLVSRVELLCEDSDINFVLLSGDSVKVPYRIYATDLIKPNTLFTEEQELIYHCLFSRHSDGFIREKHITAILKSKIPDWCFPFILKISDEYVVEILNTLYEGLTNHDNTKLKEFCKMNCPYFLYSYDRMISYWNYFYREQCFYYKNYIGRKLYKECFGYSKNLRKITTRYRPNNYINFLKYFSI